MKNIIINCNCICGTNHLVSIEIGNTARRILFPSKEEADAFMESLRCYTKLSDSVIQN